MDYSIIPVFGFVLSSAIFAVTISILARVLRLEMALKDIKISLSMMEAREKSNTEDRYGLDTRLGEIRHMRFSPFMGKHSASYPGKNEK